MSVQNVGDKKAGTDPLAALRSENRAKDEKRGGISEVQSRFMTLLTAQLKNQDPMNPLENAEMTSQLAQMSAVEGIEKLNAMFQKFVDAQTNSLSMQTGLQAANLVGRGVLVPGKAMTLTDAGAVGGVDLAKDAANVNVVVRSASGVEVAKLELGTLKAGSHNFTWDGKAANGEQAAKGQYTIEVQASNGEQPVQATALQLGQVTGVVRGAYRTDLQVGSLGIFNLDAVKQIV